MQTEIEKYDQISQYLKGSMTGQEALAFETLMAANPLLQVEVEVHKTANELIIDHHLLDIKTKTRTVVRQKETKSAFTKWGLGLVLVTVTGGALYWLLQKDHRMEVVTKLGQTEIVKNTPLVSAAAQEKNPTIAKQKEAKKVESTSFVQGKNTESVFAPITNSSQPFVSEQVDTKTLPIAEEKTASFQSAPKQVESKTAEQIVSPQTQAATSSSFPEELHLILNLSRQEPMEIPAEDNMEGSWQIFNSDGQEVFSGNIHQGMANTWDGSLRSGGLATSGQYVIMLRDKTGQTVRTGFVTVVR
jgi:hypothetical protein